MGLLRSNQKSYIKKQPKEKSQESWGVNASKKFYSTKFWRNTRDAFRKKAGNQLCAECQRVGVIKSGWVVDHIIPVPPGADLRIFKEYSQEGNLQFLCESHHNQKTNKENK